MNRDDKEFFKKIIPLIIVICVLGFFTLLFLYFYSTNYTTIKENEKIKEEKIRIEQEAKESLDEENIIVEDNTSNENTEPLVSVFEKDLKKKKASNYDKLLTGTGDLPLDNDLITEYKYDIMNYLYMDDFISAKKLAKEVNEKYDFFDENFKDFEIFIYEVLNCFENFENMSAIEKNNVIAGLDCPELILFAFNSLSFEERRGISENKYSELYDTNISSSIGLVIQRYGKDGLERAGAENVFFVTSDYDAYAIKFSYLGENYILYYLKNKKSNQTVIMGIDDLSGDITTLKEYDYVYS